MIGAEHCIESISHVMVLAVWPRTTHANHFHYANCVLASQVGIFE